jgi:molybdopterin molybdotransferase
MQQNQKESLMAKLLAVEDALNRILAAITGPVSSQYIPLEQALDRTLAADLEALLTMPPFTSSAMDGYALRSSDVTNPPATLNLAGISQAGAGYHQPIKAGEAVRIFTGAPVPDGADAVLMQEKAEAHEGAVTALSTITKGENIRAKGNDFKAGDILFKTGKRLAAADLSLIAAMGHAHIHVYRKPLVVILATGNELVAPHIIPQKSQIIASSFYAVQALAQQEGAEVINAGIVPDDPLALHEAFKRIEAMNPDVIVTLGGASVGDHDYIRAVLGERDFTFDFWRIAMKPGKPMIHGLLKGRTLLGLPGNPVSAFICTLLFLIPVIRALSGDAEAGKDRSECAILGCDVEQNKDRQDYMRVTLQLDFDTLPLVTPFSEQDSSQLLILAQADALLIRPPFAPPARKGDPCRILRL